MLYLVLFLLLFLVIVSAYRGFPIIAMFLGGLLVLSSLYVTLVAPENNIHTLSSLSSK